MSDNHKTVNTIADLRKELSRIPRARLQYAKAVSDLLSSHHISASGDLLGKLTIAACDELKDEHGEVLGVWTN